MKATTMHRHAIGIANVVTLGLLGTQAAPAAEFTLRSPGLSASAPIPARNVFNREGCKGANRSPALVWSEPPPGTLSFAVTVHDPDAPASGGWWHWTVFDIPATARGLAAGAGDEGGALPKGAVQGRNDFGSLGYGGPCPPEGQTHRYVFTVWALKSETLRLDASASGATVGEAAKIDAIGSATLALRYGRPR